MRGELTDEWKARGVHEGKEYTILTAEIAKATFGVTPGAHGRIKGLDRAKTGKAVVSRVNFLASGDATCGATGKLPTRPERK